MTQKNHYKNCVSILNSLHKDYPTFSIGRHIASALEEYGDVWSISDKELFFALTKYKAEMDINGVAHEAYVDKIVKDAMDLNHILDEEDDDL